jgi:arginyl-tRNA synthetase
MQRSRKSDILTELLSELSSHLAKHCENKVSPDSIEVLYPADPRLGDLSTNFALKNASRFHKKPREFAEEVAKSIESGALGKYFGKIDIAGPGFINFYYSDDLIWNVVEEIKREGDAYGSADAGQGKSVIIEFVSANPTGPLTIAHARQAAVGDTLCRLYRRLGYRVCAEYYLNDRGVQIRHLGESLYVRYLQALGQDEEFPDDGYKGGYITEMARAVFQDEGYKYEKMDRSKALQIFSEKAYKAIFDEIKSDLENFRVGFDSWFSEKQLEEKGSIAETLKMLRERGLAYEKDGALWFKTTEFGDEKDRVLVKSDGTTTYLTSDIPYHWDKLKRGFDLLIDILGPDHHGYISRLKSAVASYDPARQESLKVLIIQLASIFRGDEQLRMSTRAGEFVSLQQLVKEVGVDAARYFLVRLKPDSLLEFDLELARKKTPDNPVFYVQYAHARIKSVLKKYSEVFGSRPVPGLDQINKEEMEDDDRGLIKSLVRFPDTVRSAAAALEPQRMTVYLEHLAATFHSYYNKNKIVDEANTAKMDLRLNLLDGIATVIKSGLEILGVEAPDKM